MPTSGLSSETNTATHSVIPTTPSATSYLEQNETDSEPDPVSLEWIEIPVPEADRAELLITNSDGSLSVILDEEYIGDRHHPAMPGYIWSLNADVEGINNIVLGIWT